MKLRRTNDTVAPDGTADLPPPKVAAASAFDLLGGSYRAQARSRALLFIIIGVFLLVAVVGAGFAVDRTLGRLSDQAQVAALVEERTLLSAEIGELAGAAGLTEQQILGYAESRSVAIAGVLAEEIDPFAILNTVVAAAPPGTEVVSIGFEGEGMGTEAVAVSATASSFGLLVAWEDAMLDTGLFDRVDTTWLGGGDTVSVSTRGVLSAEAKGVRMQATFDRIGMPPPDVEGVAVDEADDAADAAPAIPEAELPDVLDEQP